MADFSDLMVATKAVIDPATSGADLAKIAQIQPSLRVQVAAHPNAYQALLGWLYQIGDEAVKAAVAKRSNAACTSIQTSEATFANPVEVVKSLSPQRGGQATTPQRRGLVAAAVVVVLLVAVAIVVAITQPWTKPSEGPTLTPEQFYTLLTSDETLFGDNTMQNGITVEWMQQYATDDNCDLEDVDLSGIIACRDHGYLSSKGNWGLALLFDTPSDAQAAGERLLMAKQTLAPTDIVSHEPGILKRVWTWAMESSTSDGFGTKLAQYGSVMIYADPDSDTWNEWATRLPLLQKAIDNAART